MDSEWLSMDGKPDDGHIPKVQMILVLQSLLRWRCASIRGKKNVSLSFLKMEHGSCLYDILQIGRAHV